MRIATIPAIIKIQIMRGMLSLSSFPLGLTTVPRRAPRPRRCDNGEDADAGGTGSNDRRSCDDRSCDD
jgi:hypothetical protein